MKVKLAASMLVCFNAARQSRELPAKAIIATSVRIKSLCFPIPVAAHDSECFMCRRSYAR